MPMLRRNLILSAATSLLPGASLAAAQDAPAATSTADSARGAETSAVAYEPQKVVQHINYDGGDDGAGYNSALNNMRNHVDAVGPDDIDLRVVLHGDGIGLLQVASGDQALRARIADLKAEGADFLVCENTRQRTRHRPGHAVWRL